MLMAVVLRFLRSKLFLTAIFFASLTYFIVSFYTDVSVIISVDPIRFWLRILFNCLRVPVVCWHRLTKTSTNSDRGGGPSATSSNGKVSKISTTMKPRPNRLSVAIQSRGKPSLPMTKVRIKNWERWLDNVHFRWKVTFAIDKMWCPTAVASPTVKERNTIRAKPVKTMAAVPSMNTAFLVAYNQKRYRLNQYYTTAIVPNSNHNVEGSVARHVG